MDQGQQLNMESIHSVALLALSVLLLLLVLELVRRGLLKERYALLWLGTSLFGLIIGIFPDTIVLLSRVLHFQYLTVLFVLSFIFTMGLILTFSVVISRLSERNRILTQEVAILAGKITELEKSIGREKNS